MLAKRLVTLYARSLIIILSSFSTEVEVLIDRCGNEINITVLRFNVGSKSNQKSVRKETVKIKYLSDRADLEMHKKFVRF